MRLILATRGSQLALWQAGRVADRLKEIEPGLEIEIRTVRTLGDQLTEAPLARIGVSGLFVKEIEQALLEGQADLAVHSLKDLPTKQPDGLMIAAFPEREERRDALITLDGGGLASLKQGARIGTCSLRRRAQLLRARPDLQILDLRGNLDTRLRKLEEGRFDATVLAAAGLIRMGWQHRISELLPLEVCLPAPGQGALAVESRWDREDMLDLCRKLEESSAPGLEINAERALLGRLEGGCQVPVGASAHWQDGTLTLAAMIASLDGSAVVHDSIKGPVQDISDANNLGRILADRLLEKGGREILEEIRTAAVSPPNHPV